LQQLSTQIDTLPYFPIFMNYYNPLKPYDPPLTQNWF